jgi:hypothetical protein
MGSGAKYGGGRPGRVARSVLGVLVALALFVGLFEVALRVAPGVIPLQLLRHFPTSLRSDIAGRRGLPTREQMVRIQPEDGGPPFFIYRPGATIEFDGRMGGRERTVVMDRRGFCNPDTVRYAAGSVDAVALGDSFTWCTQVGSREAWPYRLSRLGDTGTVYNLGRSSIGLYEHLAILQRFGLTLEPERVLLAFYEGNDLRDAVRWARHLAGHRRHLSATSDILCDAGDGILCGIYRAFSSSSLVAGSYSLSLLLAVVEEVAHRPDGTEIDFEYRLAFPTDTVAFNPENVDVDEVEMARRLQAGEVGFDVLDGALRRLVGLADAEGFRPTLAYIPSAHTAYADWVIFNEPEHAPVLREFSARQREYLASMADSLGMPFIDLTPYLREAAAEAGPDTLLYYRTNLHLSPAGHRVVAEALHEATD